MVFWRNYNIRSHLGYRFTLDVEDQATCIAKFASGTVAVVNVGWFSMDFQVKVELLGTVKHALACHPPSHQNRIISALQLLTTKSSEFHQPHFRELEYFVHPVRHDLPPSTSGNDGLKDSEAISLAYKNQMPLKCEDTEITNSCSQDN